MKNIFLICMCLLLVSCSSDRGEWEKLTEQAVTLYQQGRYLAGAKVTKKALSVAQKTFGPNHPNVANSLNNLAEFYRAQSKYAEAEPLFKRSLAIYEKAVGKDHPDVATVLENMARSSEKIGKKDEALKLKARARQIRSKRK